MVSCHSSSSFFGFFFVSVSPNFLIRGAESKSRSRCHNLAFTLTCSGIPITCFLLTPPSATLSAYSDDWFSRSKSVLEIPTEVALAISKRAMGEVTAATKATTNVARMVKTPIPRLMDPIRTMGRAIMEVREMGEGNISIRDLEAWIFCSVFYRFHFGGSLWSAQPCCRSLFLATRTFSWPACSLQPSSYFCLRFLLFSWTPVVASYTMTWI